MAGVIPYGGTFLIFSDYCRPAIRLSALQQVRAIYVMTHDSIGLGEDGPTHQPIEHLASLRAIPNLLVMRPADALETAECWELALAQTDRPTVLALTRQNVPALRDNASGNLSAKGAYRLRAAKAARRVILIATGSEVALAVAVADALEEQHIGADVVSMPCWELFRRAGCGPTAPICCPTVRRARSCGSRWKQGPRLAGNGTRAPMVFVSGSIVSALRPPGMI